MAQSVDKMGAVKFTALITDIGESSFIEGTKTRGFSISVVTAGRNSWSMWLQGEPKDYNADLRPMVAYVFSGQLQGNQSGKLRVRIYSIE